MSPQNLPNLESALGKFGLSSFRPGQRQVIESIIQGNDCLCVMPTGGGKSLCYQLPSIIRPGLTLVVSPLIALMKDQVDALQQRGIRATLINSTLNAAEQNERLHGVASGNYALVYIAPERLRNQRFLEAIRSTPIQLLAIDEAHCISEWGHDFRPDYARIGKFRAWLGNIQTVALTATATEKVRDDINSLLNLQQPKLFVTGFARTNLHFGVKQYQNEKSKIEDIVTFLNGRPGSGIVYAATRKRCEELVEKLEQQTRTRIAAYHAGLDIAQRRQIQEKFMAGKLDAIVATNAFGMGIDKADLRFVIHYNTPGSLEAYYQEAGRAGRDGKRSRCILQFSTQDRYIHEFFVDNNFPPKEMVKQVYEYLQRQTVDPIELTQQQIRDELNLPQSADAVGSALYILSRTRVLDRLEMGGGLAMVQIASDLPTLVDLLPREAKSQRKTLRLIESVVGDRRHENVFVHPNYLLQRSEMSREALLRNLRQLTRLEAFDFVPPFRGRAVHFRQKDVPFESLEIDFDRLEERKQSELNKLEQVFEFARKSSCRQRFVLEYFGDPNAADCGLCDRCTNTLAWECGKEAIDGDANSKGTKHASAADKGSCDKDADKAPSRSRTIPVDSQLREITRAVSKLHGRLGKTLTAQFLCGSENAKVKRLRLHRFPGFGMLSSLRQSDASHILDMLLAAGVMTQTEVNRHRPTLSVADFGNEIVSGKQSFPTNLKIRPIVAAKLASLQLGAAEQMTSPAMRGKDARSETIAQHPSSIGQPIDNTRRSLSSDSTTTNPNNKVPSRHDSSHQRGAPEPAFQRTPADPTVAKAEANTSDDSIDDAKTDRAPGRDSESQEAQQAADDWQWTLRLVVDGYSLSTCAKIRRLREREILLDLVRAVEAGKSFPLSQLLSAEQAHVLVPMLQSQLPEQPPECLSHPPELWKLVEVFFHQRNHSKQSHAAR